MEVATEIATASTEPDKTPAWDNDAWATSEDFLELVDLFWPQGITLDVFGARHAKVEADRIFLLDEGEDAYDESWDTASHNRVWVQSPYSKPNPTASAERVVYFTQAIENMEVLDLRLCSPGSEAWKKFVWPFASAIVWCGRMAFIAPPGHPKAGKVVEGNRHDLACVYHGPHSQRVRDVFQTIGGYPVTVLR